MAGPAAAAAAAAAAGAGAGLAESASRAARAWLSWMRRVALSFRALSREARSAAIFPCLLMQEAWLASSWAVC